MKIKNLILPLIVLIFSAISTYADQLAEDRVNYFRKSVPDLIISEPIKTIPKNISVYYIQCGVPVCEEIKQGIEGATKALGWKLNIITHKDTPDTVQQAWQAVVDSNPDLVLASGNPREFFEDQLAILENRKVPVVVWSLPEPYRPGKGLDANLLSGDDYYFYGVLMADYIVSESNGKADTIFFGLPLFPVLQLVSEGFEKEYKRACPTCNLKIVPIDIMDLINGKVPQVVISELQVNPNANWIPFAFGGMLFGVPEALEAVDLASRVSSISQAGGPLNFNFIANGTVQVAEVGLASEYLGWRAIDVGARLISGQDIGNPVSNQFVKIQGRPDVLAAGLPLQILEKNSLNDPNKLWPGVDNFQNKFKILWGIK